MTGDGPDTAVRGHLPVGPHARPADDVLRAVNSSRRGLSVEEVEERRSHFGPNELPVAGAPLYILLAAAAVSTLLGEWTDAGFIAAVLLVNAPIGAAACSTSPPQTWY